MVGLLVKKAFAKGPSELRGMAPNQAPGKVSWKGVLASALKLGGAQCNPLLAVLSGDQCCPCRRCLLGLCQPSRTRAVHVAADLSCKARALGIVDSDFSGTSQCCNPMTGWILPAHTHSRPADKYLPMVDEGLGQAVSQEGLELPPS